MVLEFIFRDIWRVFFEDYFLPKFLSLSEFIFVRFPVLRNFKFNFAVLPIQNKLLNK